uniref:Integrase zinc-binding domain-containing protein n=1 Tax=Ciona savignyi TaxID=51511 RepID=H2YFC3_CIOSA
SPLKTITIPRLELCDCVIGVKLTQQVKEEIQSNINRTVVWTDSTSALQNANVSKTFQRFVANRLSVIHEFFGVEQWHYVDSKNNPADAASRGIMPSRVAAPEVYLWLNGPQFLRERENVWPARPPSYSVVARVPSNISQFLSRFSSFEKLQRVLAWLARFKCYIAQRRWRSSPVRMSELFSVGEFQNATFDIVKVVQLESFAEIIGSLRDFPDFASALAAVSRPCVSYKRSRPLFRLRPILMKGVLRVGGRLELSSFDNDVKHPIILPSRHVGTSLLVNHCHVVAGHSGTQHVLAAIRERFWIVRGYSSVRYYLNSCRQC